MLKYKRLIEQLIHKVISEIERPRFDTTKQYLSAFSVEFEHGKPKIQLIDKDTFNEIIDLGI